MKNALVLAQKDARAYFQSWTGILILAFFALLSGIFFTLATIAYAKLSLQVTSQAMAGIPGFTVSRYVFNSMFVNLGNVLMFIVPFLSMKALAEEKSLQTLELLYTYPISDVEIVWGKFAGMLRFFVFMTLPTLSYALFLKWAGAVIEWRVLASMYAGFLLLGAAYLSLGLFVSSLASNPVLSAIVTFSLILIFWIMEWIAGVTDGQTAAFFTQLSPLNHYKNFALGILDLNDLVYFVFFVLYFLFLSLRCVESRNWKG